MTIEEELKNKLDSMVVHALECFNEEINADMSLVDNKEQLKSYIVQWYRGYETVLRELGADTRKLINVIAKERANTGSDNVPWKDGKRPKAWYDKNKDAVTWYDVVPDSLPIQ